MKLLIIGGTAFVGRTIAREALERGHSVSVFHRGKTNPDLFKDSDVEHLIGDRDGDLAALEGRQWDVVVDTYGYVPRVVEQSAKLLQNAVKQYVFISTISVYADLEKPGINENSPVTELEDPTTEEITGETYGGLKVLCERVVQQYFPDNHLIIRPGLIIGPHDYTHRFAYWILRGAEGGTMLAPGDPAQPMQLIDVRDLANFTLDLAEQRASGIFNATGHGIPLGEVLKIIRDTTGSDVEFEWVDEQFLLENDITPWVSLPMWVPAESVGIHQVDISHAVAAGLKFRPMRETIEDSYHWLEEHAKQPDAKPQHAQGALPREREVELLTAWMAQEQVE